MQEGKVKQLQCLYNSILQASGPQWPGATLHSQRVSLPGWENRVSNQPPSLSGNIMKDLFGFYSIQRLTKMRFVEMSRSKEVKDVKVPANIFISNILTGQKSKSDSICKIIHRVFIQLLNREYLLPMLNIFCSLVNQHTFVLHADNILKLSNSHFYPSLWKDKIRTKCISGWQYLLFQFGFAN